MIELKDRLWLEDGIPTLHMSGEIHYFRIPRERWQETLDHAREAGLDTIATYVPWHMHEEVEGRPDWTGRTRPELDLPAFLTLCAKNGFSVFFRPGPFIMAEMKNEGIPYWLRRKHPHLISTSWDGATVPTAALDLTHPDFLDAVRTYYHGMFAHVRPFLAEHGGPIVAIQLDNEIGMLSWVANAPDLTDHVVASFRSYLKDVYGSAAERRYPGIDAPGFATAVRHPAEATAPSLHLDLGRFNRRRFSTYAEALAAMLDAEGVHGIPYVVNVHGTADGRALKFPIGLSQLRETWDRPGFVAGSDLYLGEFSMENFHDFYIVNGMQESLNRRGQPLTTVEFNCGDGNWGDSLAIRLDPASTACKTRMCLAQGHRLVNYYLFAGGHNPRLLVPPGDGNDRIAITGERHGFAAPLGPEGQKNITFAKLAEVNGVAQANAVALARMVPVLEPVAFGWIPDAFMTESRYPGSERMRSIHGDLERHRAGVLWEVVAKMFLLRHVNFAVADLQDSAASLSSHRLLAVETGVHVPRAVQERLVSYVRAGGTLLLFGDLPTKDDEDLPCTLLADALGVRPGRRVTERERPFLAAMPCGFLSTFPEHQVWEARAVDPGDAAPLYRLYGTEETVAFETTLGAGKVLVFLVPLPGNLALLDALLSHVGIVPTLTDDAAFGGVFALKSRAGTDEWFHLVNVDNVPKDFHLGEAGIPLFEGVRLHLPGRDGLLLAHGATIGSFRIAAATLEVARVEPDALHFRAVPGDHLIVVEAPVPPRVDVGRVASIGPDRWRVSVHLSSDDHAFVLFRT